MKISKLKFTGEFFRYRETNFPDDAGKMQKKLYADFVQDDADAFIPVRVEVGNEFEKGQVYDILVDFSSYDFKGNKGFIFKAV